MTRRDMFAIINSEAQVYLRNYFASLILLYSLCFLQFRHYYGSTTVRFEYEYTNTSSSLLTDRKNTTSWMFSNPKALLGFESKAYRRSEWRQKLD